MSHPPPPIRSVIVAYWLIPVSYLLALAIVLYQRWTGRLEKRSWFLFVAALIGLACLHQAMHRMDPGHLIQILPPAIVCVSLIATELLRGDSRLGRPTRLTPWIRAAGVGYAILLVALGFKLSRWGQADLEAFSPWPAARYAGLADPLGQADRDPKRTALAAVTRLTHPTDPILAFPIAPQLYALTNRRISGRLHAYYAGVFDSPDACAANLKAVRDDMPALVIVPADFSLDPQFSSDALALASRRSHMYLEQFIRQHYTRTVCCAGGTLVLGRSDVH
jgi:hypothetical protein